MATADVKPEVYLGTGRRKSSVARVRIREGGGQILINKRPLEEYFPREQDVAAVRAPLVSTELTESIDCTVNVNGGGMSGQSGAVMMGIARALMAMRSDLEVTLRDGDFLTRDSRMKERKKYGQKGARKSFQFSKR